VQFRPTASFAVKSTPSSYATTRPFIAPMSVPPEEVPARTQPMTNTSTIFLQEPLCTDNITILVVSSCDPAGRPLFMMKGSLLHASSVPRPLGRLGLCDHKDCKHSLSRRLNPARYLLASNGYSTCQTVKLSLNAKRLASISPNYVSIQPPQSYPRHTRLVR
jgi:hypothetical protein